MTRYFFVLSIFISLILYRQIQAEKTPPRKIILLEQAKQISEHAIKKASKSESELNEDGGYNANISVIDCFAAMEYCYTGGQYVNQPIKFRMLMPDKIQPDKKYPLILWLHGSGESGDDNKRQLAHMQSAIETIAGKNKQDFFMIATQCPYNTDWSHSVSNEGKGDAPLTIAVEILDAVIQEYPIDTNKLGTLGFCSGGSAAWNVVSKYPGRFASMAAFSTSPPANPHNFKQTAIWAFNNKDDSIPWKPMEQFINSINAAGGNAYVTLKEYGGHNTWKNALQTENVLDWAILQDLKKIGYPAGIVIYHRTAGQTTLLFGLPILILLLLQIISVVSKNSKHDFKKNDE
ncbi:MAG: dienelactone hydrolase family protein [Planctomycetaceae bacterium]|nr:dienelactone hydrolase family protein [Planctomycetaceae bacterium]